MTRMQAMFEKSIHNIDLMHPLQTENIPMGKTNANMCLFDRSVKRSFDIIAATICLILFSPLFLIFFIAIIIDDGKPAIYRQERIGYKGKSFTLYKFRSMRLDAENGCPKLFNSNTDNRLTRVGKFLRKHHLDELPQLWNVLLGDMSFVGPRPERLYYINKIMKHNPRYVELYKVRPGVTSNATLYNGYTDTMEKMLKRLDMDLNDLEHRSITNECKILIKTFLSIITGKVF